MNKKNDKYGLFFNSKHDGEKIINHHFNFNNIDDEKFKEEALFIYNSINEGKIDLDPNEKEEIFHELELILNHFDSSQSNEKSKDLEISKNLDNKINSYFKVNQSMSENYSSSEDNFNSHVESINFNNDLDDKSLSDMGTDNEINEELDIDDSIPVGDVVDSFDVVEEEVSSELSVDDALDELVENESSSIFNNDFVIEDSFDDSIPVGDVVDSFDVVEEEVSSELSVDDALNELVESYSNEIAIKVENLSMQFKVSKDKIDTLKELIIRTIKRNKSKSKIVTALDDISFEIPKGDRVGVIGFNAAGKSTLLKVLAKVYDATGGTIETKGKIAPLLELGAGFDSNYTGKDNIFLYGAFLGYSEDFLKEKYDEILEFSELGDAIDYHVKTYSSGMRAKLAFSIATIVEPDILILDEILSVGDIKFRKKSSDKIRSLINSGITVLLVSHSVGQIRDLCNKAIWIDEGKLIMYGEVNEVCDAYVKAAANATKDQLENIHLD